MQRITSGDDVKAWRRANAYDQDRLAKELGVTRQTIGNWEKKRRDIPRYVEIALQALARYPWEFSIMIGQTEKKTESMRLRKES